MNFAYFIAIIKREVLPFKSINYSSPLRSKDDRARGQENIYLLASNCLGRHRARHDGSAERGWIRKNDNPGSPVATSGEVAIRRTTSTTTSATP